MPKKNGSSSEENSKFTYFIPVCPTFEEAKELKRSIALIKDYKKNKKSRDTDYSDAKQTINKILSDYPTVCGLHNIPCALDTEDQKRLNIAQRYLFGKCKLKWKKGNKLVSEISKYCSIDDFESYNSEEKKINDKYNELQISKLLSDSKKYFQENNPSKEKNDKTKPIDMSLEQLSTVLSCILLSCQNIEKIVSQCLDSMRVAYKMDLIVSKSKKSFFGKLADLLNFSKKLSRDKFSDFKIQHENIEESLQTIEEKFDMCMKKVLPNNKKIRDLAIFRLAISWRNSISRPSREIERDSYQSELEQIIKQDQQLTDSQTDNKELKLSILKCGVHIQRIARLQEKFLKKIEKYSVKEYTNALSMGIKIATTIAVM